jgi:hypothetical protein
MKLKGLIKEKEKDNNSPEIIKTSEPTSKPTKNGVDISTQEVTKPRDDNKNEDDLKLQTRVENQIPSVTMTPQTPRATTLLTRQPKRNPDQELVSRRPSTPLIPLVPIPLVTTQITSPTTQSTHSEEETKIKGSVTSSQMSPVMTLESLVSPTTSETIPPTTLLKQDPKQEHQHMHKRVDKKKPRVNTQKFKKNKKRCRGENIKSWVKSQIKNTPRKTKKEFQPKTKVSTTPRQAKTCRLEQSKLDQGRRKTTSGTNTTIWFSLLGRGRPPETNLESLLLDRNPNKSKKKH